MLVRPFAQSECCSTSSLLTENLVPEALANLIITLANRHTGPDSTIVEKCIDFGFLLSALAAACAALYNVDKDRRAMERKWRIEREERERRRKVEEEERKRRSTAEEEGRKLRREVREEVWRRVERRVWEGMGVPWMRRVETWKGRCRRTMSVRVEGS